MTNESDLRLALAAALALAAVVGTQFVRFRDIGGDCADHLAVGKPFRGIARVGLDATATRYVLMDPERELAFHDLTEPFICRGCEHQAEYLLGIPLGLFAGGALGSSLLALSCVYGATSAVKRGAALGIAAVGASTLPFFAADALVLHEHLTLRSCDESTPLELLLEVTCDAVR